MKTTFLIGTVALVAVLTGCNSGGSSSNESAAAGNAATNTNDPTYSGAGKVTKIAGDQVSIAHGPIPGIGWPAMTMTFTAPGNMAQGVKTGDAVAFQFRKDGAAYALTSLTRQ
jgi:Cu(I)/Ag(I) efflux system membrane fusion protein